MTQRKIEAKLVEIQKNISGVKKDSKVQMSGRSYDHESLNSIIELLHPLLSEQDMGIMHNVVWHETHYELLTTVFDSDGSIVVTCPIPSEVSLIVRGNAMQGMGASITYARRYNLKNLFNLYGTDDDASCLTNKPKKATAEQKALIKTLVEHEKVDDAKFYEWLGTSDLDTLDENKANQAITLLKGRVK